MINEHIGMQTEMPHGGYKESGAGKALSAYSIESATNIKHVYVDLQDTVDRGWHTTVFGTSLAPKKG
jgi:betaine-aldehyde dehydrogenase